MTPNPTVALGGLLLPTSTDPAIAAAMSIMAGLPALPPPHSLDPALRAVAPHLSDSQRMAWGAALAIPLRRGGITSSRALAAFLGQCAFESAGFRTLEEDLTYSADRLCQVWPNRFPNVADAVPCANEPERLANRVYANRMGNGDEASGDGWLFRGRGLIQITGRTAYQQFARAMNMPLQQAVAHAASVAGAAESAVWFWTAHQLNPLAEAWSLDSITRKINGGLNGAAERTRLCDAALQVIGA